MKAAEFSQAFIQAYNNARTRYDDTQWRDVWSQWSHHMLWKETSVIQETAKSVGLKIARGEPLRLDAILVKEDDLADRFPTQVALEHERAIGTFYNELRALFSVRAPLKVGITYIFKSTKSQAWNPVQWVQEQVQKHFVLAGAAISEAPETEYLFLIGDETSDRVLTWMEMSFTAAVGPELATFQPFR